MTDSYALSPIQGGMLYHTLAHPDAGVDVEQIVCTLQESVDLDRLLAAWQRLVDRHACLRTSFAWAGRDEPIQTVHESATLPVDTLDLRGLPADQRHARITEFLDRDRTRGFDPAVAPLSRVTVLQLDDETRVVWTFHHLLLDGRSFPDVLQEVFDDYDAQREGRAWSAPARPAFGDHIEQLAHHDHKESIEFWRRRLSGFTAPTPLLTETNGNVDWRTPGRRDEVTVELDAAATDRLRATAEEHGVSVNNLVQAAWAVVLARYSGSSDIVFGATRAGRRSSIPNADDVVGVFINTLPLRVAIEPKDTILDVARRIRSTQREVRDHESTPLVDIQNACDVKTGLPLFKSILVFDNYLLGPYMRRERGQPDTRDFVLHEKTNYPLTLYGYADRQLLLKLAFDADQFDRTTVERALGAVESILRSTVEHPNGAVATAPLLTSADLDRVLREWNATACEFPAICTHQAIEEQARQRPDEVALVQGDRRLTYRQLDRKANALAAKLRDNGVGPDRVVGVCTDRSLEMMIGLLAIHKAGGAYLPLDPTYPEKRLAFMVEDARVGLILAERAVTNALPAGDYELVQLDGLANDADDGVDTAPSTEVLPEHLAYLIYTSGSTGKPKGVMVQHRNVLNFFAGMDQRIGPEPGVWLAVTSLSFDISVLELFWTLARGYRVVLYSGIARDDSAQGIQFSLFYFASDQGESPNDKYHLLLEGARFADANGFHAVWTPERHFHEFGGLYPNPAVAGAALATMTKNVQIRAGSVVLPLHSPLRVAEEWSVVDNLSGGRTGIAIASGWHPNDFVLAPDGYDDRHAQLVDNIEKVRTLWRGERVPFTNPRGEEVPTQILPRPIQPNLPMWITAAGNPETFRTAGRIGASILTHLLGQSLEEVRQKLTIYREAWREAGHPGDGHVTLMLHTFVGPDGDEVKATVREPMRGYLRSAMDLIKKHAAAWSATRTKLDQGEGAGVGDLSEMPEEDIEALLDFSFERYYETSALFGTPESCVATIDRVCSIGVDEIACLIDFGVPSQKVLEHLPYLDELRRRIAAQAPPPKPADTIDELVERHEITHLQCTPSMARMLVADTSTSAALGRLEVAMVGGEALPQDLADRLSELVGGRVLNMYGPTETTIWSSVADVDGTPVTIGRPIANTQLYVLDTNRQPVPIGVPGELYIGGDGVTKGYLRREELTAERFVDNPFGKGRLYRTGDEVRFRDDGQLDFLGRIDQQAKVRGYRVELGEIAAELTAHDGVGEAVVVLENPGREDVRMLAFYTPAGDAPETGTLVAHLRTSLPEFMIPSEFIAVDSFPLTPNGKIDRNALVARDREKAPAKPVAPRREPVAATGGPASDADRSNMRAIWTEVLGAAEIGDDDNFFDLGGHSLLTIKLQTRLRENLSVDVPLVDLFRFTTVRTLSDHVASLSGAELAGAAKETTATSASKRAARRREIMRRRRE